VAKDGRPVALNVFVPLDTVANLGQHDLRVALRTSSGSRRRSSPFSSITTASVDEIDLREMPALAPATSSGDLPCHPLHRGM
jgi:hypothetical protein